MKWLRKNHVRFGLLGTVVFMVCLLLLDISGNDYFLQEAGPTLTSILLILPILLWYFGIRAKKRQNGNHLAFRQGVKEGYKIALVFALSSPFAFLLYYLILNVGTLTGLGKAVRIEEVPSVLAIVADMMVQFWGIIIFGTMYGILVSAFLKSKK
jgi:hypothetical protein